jgi:signal transduction histidine kinase/ActR/RegA family two-component response regulator
VNVQQFFLFAGAPVPSADAIALGDREMAGRLRALRGGSETPHGLPANWPPVLEGALASCLESHQPTFVWWGPELVLLYNDAGRPLVGCRHPQALARPGWEGWPELWSILGPALTQVYEQGEPATSGDVLLPVERQGMLEESYFVFVASPVRDEDGSIGGVAATAHETTERVLGERRLRTFLGLGASALPATSVDEACAAIAACLAANPNDIPFALLYLLDSERRQAHLAGAAGLQPGTSLAPRTVTLDDADGWPLARVAATGDVERVDDLAQRFGPLPAEAAGHLPRTALVLPVLRPGNPDPRALLVVGLSPWRPLDVGYRGFLDLVSGEIAVALESARARERAQRQTRTLEAMAQVFVGIAAPSSLDARLAAITRRACTLLTATRAVTCLRRGPDWAQSRIAVFPPESPRVIDGTGPYAVVCSTNQTMRLESGDLGAPLVDHDGRNMGFILLSAHADHEFDGHDEDLATQLARMASVVIENARLLEEAEAASSAADDFLHILSHDLRSPLSTTRLWIHLLRSGTLDPAKTTRAFETIERDTRLQEQLLDDVLEAARVIGGRPRLARDPVDLADVARAALAAVQEPAAAKAIVLDFRHEPPGPVVSGDAERLGQALGHLVANAVKFTPAGGRVTVELERTDRQAHVRVIDSGPGIPAEQLDLLLPRASRSETSRRQGRRGLGLAVARHLVERHDGAIQIESPGSTGGTTFTITLPLAPIQQGPVAEGPALPTPPRCLQDVRVLVVDDHEDVRESLVCLLEHSGAAVTAAASAAEALQAVREAPLDIVVSDLGMPHEDGFTLIREIRALGSTRGGDVLTVAFSAYADAATRARAAASGYDGFVAKPVDATDLTELIASLVDANVGRRRTDAP